MVAETRRQSVLFSVYYVASLHLLLISRYSAHKTHKRDPGEAARSVAKMTTDSQDIGKEQGLSTALALGSREETCARIRWSIWILCQPADCAQDIPAVIDSLSKNFKPPATPAAPHGRISREADQKSLSPSLPQ